MHPFYHHMISSSFLGIHICFKHVFKHYCSITSLCSIRVKMGPDKGDKDLSIEIWSGPWTIRSIGSINSVDNSWTTASFLKKYGVYFYPQFKVSPPLTLASSLWPLLRGNPLALGYLLSYTRERNSRKKEGQWFGVPSIHPIIHLSILPALLLVEKVAVFPWQLFFRGPRLSSVCSPFLMKFDDASAAGAVLIVTAVSE